MQDASTVSSLVVGGEEVRDGSLVDVRSPWDGRIVGRVPTVGPDAARAAIDAAHRSMRTGLPAHERAAILDRAAAIVNDRRVDLARLISSENGKPYSLALAEADRCVQTLVFSAVEARSLAGRGVPLDAHPAGVGHLGFTLRYPVGVVGAITPFNFPLSGSSGSAD